MKYLTAAAFVGTVYAANWALTTYGVIHLFGGLYAPAGVFFAGLGFGDRTLGVRERAGRNQTRPTLCASNQRSRREA